MDFIVFYFVCVCLYVLLFGGTICCKLFSVVCAWVFKNSQTIRNLQPFISLAYGIWNF